MESSSNERREDCWRVYMHIAPNNKRYIGITSHKNLTRRTGSNGWGYKTQTLFYRAIQKYGWNNFQHIVIAENLTCEDACKLEIELIKKYKSNNPEYGYNISVGGNGIRGGSMQPVDREKIAKASRERFLGKPSPRKGKHITEEHKSRISQSLLGHIHSEETKRKIGLKSLGRTHNRGRRWFNNGKINRFTFECPEGFVPGVITKKKSEEIKDE